jgi:hypothetical protein
VLWFQVYLFRLLVSILFLRGCILSSLSFKNLAILSSRVTGPSAFLTNGLLSRLPMKPGYQGGCIGAG